MATKHTSTMVICPNIVMQGNLKVAGDIEFFTNFTGNVRSTGQVRIRSGVHLALDLQCDSLWLEPGASFKGSLQVGEARKPLSRLWSWFNQLGAAPPSKAE
jgi:cytoskeletal protein CcmA (bactofilin family)